MNIHNDLTQTHIPAGPPSDGNVLPDFHPMFPVSEECYPHASFESCMVVPISLRSLGNSLPSERALVAKCLMEVARQINETIPATAGNEPEN